MRRPKSNLNLEFQLFKQTENLDEDFEISDGVILPAGSSHDWLRYQAVYDGAEHRALSGRVEYSWGDPWISLSNNLQYDSESGEVGWQLRFRWIQKPGNDVFFIWTQNWTDEDGRGFSALDRRGAAKIVRTIRF